MHPVSVRKIMGKIVNIPIYIIAFFIVMFFMAMDHVAWYAEEYILCGVSGICLLNLLSVSIFGIPSSVAMSSIFILSLLLVGFVTLSVHYTFYVPTYSESEKTDLL